MGASRTPAHGLAAASLRWTIWGLSAAVTIGLLAQPVGPEAQLWLCGAACAGMLALWLLAPRRGLPRLAFLALGTLVVIRYVYWRLTGTLPSLDDPVGLGFGMMLLGAELYCVLILAVSLVVTADPLVRETVPFPADADLPAVDVLIPSYNEPTEILAVTLAAALNLDYPADKLTVWLLDDGGTDQKCADPNPAKAAAAQERRAELQALCAALGACYLTRARNEHAKAGNLNNGLTASRAEIVLVLDADHAPFRSFLRETVGLFSEDPNLFLVQTPHVFLNPDPVERNLRTFARMPSENEMFYGVTQAGLDKWNGSFFCGSAALLRRRALDAVGGFSGITITEDCETALDLHGRGWTSAYVGKPLIAGLQPESLADFIGQRARWCQGMIQILMLKNPLMKPGLRPIQRLAYLSSMTFWFFPLPRLVFMLAPLLHIFFDVKIFVSSVDEAIAYTATYIVANLMIQNYLYGHVRWPFVSELYEYVQGVYLARSIASVIVSPRRPSFSVTAKGAGLAHDHLSPLAWPFFAIFAALAAGCGMAAWRYLYEPGVTSLMLVVGLWCGFNLVIAGVALGAVAERRQEETTPSLPVGRPALAAIGDERVPVTVERMSAEAATLRLRRADGAPFPAMPQGGLLQAGTGPALRFTLRAAPAPDLRVVAFAPLAPAEYRTVAGLMYGDAAALRGFLAGRRRHRDLVTGTLRFLAWGVAEPLRAVSYLGRSAPPALPAPAVPEAASAAELPAVAAIPPVAARVPAAEPSPQVILADEIARDLPATLAAALAPVAAAPASVAPVIPAKVASPAVAPAAIRPEPVPAAAMPALTPGSVDAPVRAPAVPSAMPEAALPQAAMAEADWRAAIAGLLAAAPGLDRAPPPDAATLDAAFWAESIRALAGAGAVPAPLAPPRRQAVPLAPSAAPALSQPLEAGRPAAARDAA
ncbi:UDP-forming cellulose synthase catalytic subunit [Methylobacterium nonmethylotrophicum]|uniref:Cellulose synthase catalytic subunit [UDP-forming] n=1 Tax=Methylobacterium nonmethylotrophicum TaxID=1141884 RepID=A0A4Z0NI22_9HYPH|nr:UDP-forming cellulose synthase catalytic subunit [Methylobacterium nonmethylotrophicum]TGD95934.1 UDP-forming cellulose synthase catalytic subunit [Methylobacterium nonmethylotrophicum]